MIQLTIIPRHYVNSVWERAAPLIDKAVDFSHKRYCVEAVYDELMSEAQQLWILFDDEDDDIKSAFTTMVIKYPLRRILSFAFLGGDGFLDHMQLVHDRVKEWAIKAGCDGFEVAGRKGWEKALKKIDFNFGFVSMIKDF